MGIFCSKLMRYLAMLFMVSIFFPGSSQMPDDQLLSMVGNLLNKEHETDSNENLARHLTKDDKTSIKDGLLMLLKMFKDGDKDSLALSNEPKAEEIDPRSNMDAEQSWREEAESRQGTELNGETNDVGPDMRVIAMPPELRTDQKLKSSNSFKLWKEQREERMAGSRSFSSDSNKCPYGYKFGIQGDVPQAGIISLVGRNIPANKERCAEICNHNSRCRSFIYSPTVGRCKITAELDPIKAPYNDWIMCTKLDARCPQGYTYKTGSVDGDAKTLVEEPLMIDRTGITDGQTDEECKIMCDMDPTCKAFEYSTKKQKCVRRIVGKPNTNSSRFEDYEWCSKNQCKTTDGPVVNKECVFPFIWREKSYEACTNVGKSNKGRFWCPTSAGDINVDKDSKTWGFCSDDCPRHEAHCYAIAGPGIGKDCVFPFKDRGMTYHRCAKSHPLGSPQWCKTDEKEALSESIKSFGVCHSGCDSVKECSWEKLGGSGTVAEIEGNTVASHSSKTLDECKDLCDLNIECKSFSFTQKGGMCKLKDRILSRDMKTKHVPGTSTYYEPAACHDDDGNSALAGYLRGGSRSVNQGMKRYISDSGSKSFGVGDIRGPGSKHAVNEIRGAYRNGGGNDADRIGGGYRSGSDDGYKGFAGNDVFDTDTIVREVGVNYGTGSEDIAQGNEGGYRSRVEDDGRGMRDGYVSVSRTGAKGVSKAKEVMSKKHAKIWDKVLKHQSLLQKLDDLRYGNV